METALQKSFAETYDNYKHHFYSNIFELIRARGDAITPMEVIQLEIISMLQKPTISQFADFLSISQSNATYKINSLIKKGYLAKENSPRDRREYYLVLTEKFRSAERAANDFRNGIMDRVAEQFSEEEVATFRKIMNAINSDFMPAEFAAEESEEL